MPIGLDELERAAFDGVTITEVLRPMIFGRVSEITSSLNESIEKSAVLRFD